MTIRDAIIAVRWNSERVMKRRKINYIN